MASLSGDKLKAMEAEMDRFEQELLGQRPGPAMGHSAVGGAPKMIIGAQTFKKVQAALQTPKETEDSEVKKPSSYSAPPPPPPTSSGPPSRGQQNDQPFGNMGLRPPPPPPPPGGRPPGPPAFLPPQLRHGPPGRPPFPPPPPPMGMPPRPPMGRPPPGPPPPPPMMGPQGMGPMPPRGPFMPNNYPIQKPAEIIKPPVIEKPKVVYSAPPVKKQKIEKKKKKKDKSESEVSGAGDGMAQGSSDVGAYTAPGIELNVPAYESEHQRISQAETHHGDIDGVEMPEFTQDSAPKEKKEKKKKFIRTAAGQVWEDQTLLDWDTDDFRMFCGDLGNEVTDETLVRAFSRYPSFQRAKVVRDKRTNKTKGYGFVSFKDPNDFVKAMREMNGKYVGNRPIKLRKSSWKDRQIDVVKKKDKEKKRLGLK